MYHDLSGTGPGNQVGYWQEGVTTAVKELETAKENIVKEMTNQTGLICSQVKDVWNGPDADKFETLTNNELLAPLVKRIEDLFTTLQEKINETQKTIDQNQSDFANGMSVSQK